MRRARLEDMRKKPLNRPMRNSGGYSLFAPIADVL